MDPLISAMSVEVAAKVIVEGGAIALDYLLPSFARVLDGRFGRIPGRDIVRARDRAQPFVRELSERIVRLEEQQRVTREVIEEKCSRPEVSSFISTVFETVIDTDDPLTRSVLVDLVIERLTASDESNATVATRVAAEQLRNLTPRQIKLLALAVFLHVSYDDEQTALPYEEWLVKHKPVVELAWEFDDFLQLQSLGLISQSAYYQDLQRSGFTAPPVVPIARRLHVPSDPVISEIYFKIMDFSTQDALRKSGVMLAAYDVSPAGWLIGNLARRHLIAGHCGSSPAA